MNSFYYLFFVFWWKFFDVFNCRGGFVLNMYFFCGCSWKCGCRDGGRGIGYFYWFRVREKKFSIECFVEKFCW